MQEIQLQYIHNMCNIFYLTRQLITKISVLFIKNVHCHETKPKHQDIHIIHFQAEKVIYNSFDSTGATKQTK